jgi:hypothetical protein
MVLVVLVAKAVAVVLVVDLTVLLAQAVLEQFFYTTKKER